MSTTGPAYQEIETDTLVEYLYNDILIRAHSRGVDPTWDKVVEDAWSTRNGFPYFEREVYPTYARGYPGMGKTTAFKKAAKQAAQDLGLNFVYNPSSDYEVGQNDFVFVQIELAGEASPTAVNGIPGRTSVRSAGAEDSGSGKDKYTERMPNYAIGALKNARAGILLFDDFANAGASVQNAALPIAEEGRSPAFTLENEHGNLSVLVGLTGNLGSIDGTHTVTTSAATSTRVQTYRVQDTLENWMDRTKSQYNDPIGDAGYTEFLKQNPDLFHVPDNSRLGNPYPAPRTHSKAVNNVREIVHKYEYQQMQALRARQEGRSASDPVFDLEKLENVGSSLLGKDTGSKLASFYYARMTHAAPLAKELIETGTLTEDSLSLLSNKWGQGLSADEQTFGNHFFSALANYAAEKIERTYVAGDQAGFEASINAMSRAMFELAPDPGPLAVFSTTLAENLTRITSAPAKIGRSTEVGPMINDDLLKDMVRIMAQNQGAHASTHDDKNGEPVRLIESGFIYPITLLSQHENEVNITLQTGAKAADDAGSQPAPNAEPAPAQHTPSTNAPATPGGNSLGI